MMKYFLRCTLVYILFSAMPLSILAQDKFEPAKITLLNGDTLSGFIEYKNWRVNPRSIKFQKALGGTVAILGLPDLKGFSVHGEDYIKAGVILNESSDRPGDLTFVQQPQTRSDSVFLLTLVQGPKALYFYRNDNDKVNLYIGTDRDQFELLLYYRYMMEANGRQGIVMIDTYRDRLKTLFQDCQAFNERSWNVTYSENSIKKLFDTYYNKCSASGAKTSIRLETTMMEFGVTAGASSTKLRFKSGTARPLTGTDFNYSRSVNFQGGAFLNIVFPRARKRVSINNELFFSSYRVTAPEYEGQGYNYHPETTLGYSYLKLNNLVRYRIPRAKISPFLNAGISNGFAIAETNESVTQIGSSQVKGNGIDIGPTRKYEQGLLFGAGVAVQKFSIEARFETSNGMSRAVLLGSNVKKLSLLLSYRLK